MYQQTVCFFTAVFRSGFHLKLQSVAMMVSSRKGLLEDETEQSLLKELTASDQSSCSDDDDSSGTDDLTVVEVTVLECSDNESEDVQCATASSAPTASRATFTCEDMTNYVGQRKQFVDNYGPQNEAQNETHCAKVFVDDELVELIVRETNTYAAQKKKTSQKFHSIVFQNVGLETCHYRRNVCCVSTFHADGNNTEAHATLIFFKKLYLSDSNLRFYYFYGSV